MDRLFTYQLLLSKVEILKLRCYSPIQLMAGLFVAAYRGNEIVNVMELSSYLFQSTTLILSVILTQNHLLSARKSCVMLGFVGFASAWNCQGHVVGFVGFASLELAGASCWIRWIRSLELSLGSLKLSDRIGIPVHDPFQPKAMRKVSKTSRTS